MNKMKIFIIILSLLLLAIACDPSYKMEFPNLTEENYNNLSLEEKFQIFINASQYIDTPPYVYENIAKEGEKVIPLILSYIESSAPVDKKGDVISLLVDVNKYFDLKNTKVEAFLLKKAENNSDPNLGSYKFVLRMIRPEIEKDVIITQIIGNTPAFYSNDEDIIDYVALIKEKIMQETGIKQKELDNRFSIVGYAKGEKSSNGVLPLDNRTVIISFVTKIDWINFNDRIEFYFLNDYGTKISLEEIKQQIKVPFYFNINKLKPRSEIEKIVTAKDPRLELVILKPDNKYNIRIDELSKQILLTVFGTIDKKQNKCIAGEINAITGDISVKNQPCVIY